MAKYEAASEPKALQDDSKDDSTLRATASEPKPAKVDTDTEAKEAEKNGKFEKGGDKDLSNGPCEKRGCTDIVCLILYLANWGLLFALIFLHFGQGNPTKLYRPRDFRGDFCGLETNWNGMNLKDQVQQTYTMNVSKTVEKIAQQLVCSTIAEETLAKSLTVAEMRDYRCACCKDACASCSGSFAVPDYTSPSSLASSVSGKMGEFTGISSATDLFSTDGANGDFITGMWAEVTSYFNKVCLPACNSPEPGSVNVNSSRTYTYSPPPDVPWYRAWTVLADSSRPGADAAITSAIANSFKFGALDKTTCPYEDQYCVPFPGITFEEVYANYCTFKMATEIVASIGSSASTAFESIGANKISDTTSEGFGDAFGTFLKTLDVFAIVCVLSFVIGFIFMIVLRFLVRIAVYLAVILVLCLWLMGGAFLYVRSEQCKGSGLFDTGEALANTAMDAGQAAVTSSSANEAMTGNGADYRGVQKKTRSGKACQAWDVQSPHQHETTSMIYPKASLVSSYCRNPGNPDYAPTIWCYTTDPDVRWELCTPIGVLQPGCPMGYQIESETFRTVSKVCAYICWGFAVLWVLLICCKSKALRLAIAILECAAKFVSDVKGVVFIPLVQIVIAILWIFIWGFIASFVLTQVPEDRVPTGSFATWVDVMGTNDTQGQCNNEAPVGGAWKYYGDLNSANDTCSGNYGNTDGITPACWKCFPPRYVLGWRFWVELFVYLWNAAFLVAVGQCVIAGAVGIWFFRTDTSQPVSLKKALHTCFRYHLGSMAVGSFILALVQLARYICRYLSEQAKAQKNKVAQCVFKCIECCLWCFEKCVKFMNRQAYIQVALMGTNFLQSAKNAFFLLLRNIVRFGILTSLGTVIYYVGYLFIMAATTVVGYMILQAMHSDVNVVVPVISYMAIGFMIGRLFMSVFAVAIDAMLHCFVAAEEMKIGECVPSNLRGFMRENVPAEHHS
jgi:hypothetical protein